MDHDEVAAQWVADWCNLPPAAAEHAALDLAELLRSRLCSEVPMLNPPTSSPTCEHQWSRIPKTPAFRCQDCGSHWDMPKHRPNRTTQGERMLLCGVCNLDIDHEVHHGVMTVAEEYDAARKAIRNGDERAFFDAHPELASAARFAFRMPMGSMKDTTVDMSQAKRDFISRRREERVDGGGD